MTTLETSSPAAARTLFVGGQVQGVGFRPFVYRLATEMGLAGSVRNDAAGVTILLHGPAGLLDRFERRLLAELPPLARVEVMRRQQADPSLGAVPCSFVIVDSAPEPTARGRVTVDTATCADCLRELDDPRDRRHRHALINCTNCGPRYTIVRDVPYDRPRTTMAAFALCPACATEYRDPADRRFHAQPVCCPSCGPQVRLTFADGTAAGADPLRAAAACVRQGRTVAMKGLGGYHLVADATNAAAVERLRCGKRRDHKPFAVMARDLRSLEDLVVLSPAARAALLGPVAPIVLARRRAGAAVAAAVAPGLHRLGVMLPHTPMQHLLFREGLGPLVMTSANRSDEPLLIDDDDARTQLTGLADAWLAHDRPIERAVDDSVLLDGAAGLLPIRRARGLVPAPLALPVSARAPGLCLGGELKSVVAVVVGGQAVLSQHLGDLAHTLAYERFLATIDDLLRLYQVAPEWIACDAHPAYLSRRHALALARRRGVPLLQVQHHHAHLAALLAEHGLEGPVVGLIADGVGYGEDGTSWGGEVLVGDLVRCQRVGRLRPLRLPGGDAAAKETGRCGLSWLFDGAGPAALESEAARRAVTDDDDRAALATMLRRNLNCPPSSGLGRLFDAAAALLRVCDFNHHEAMSGMRLEALADGATATGEGNGLLAPTEIDGLLELDHRPLLRRLVDGLDRREPVERLSRLFHEAVAHGFVRAATRAAHAHGLGRVVLGGGVFCNDVLASLVRDQLEERGFEVLTHRQVPPNDGGLALGQAAIGAACFQATTKRGEPCA